MPLALHLPVVCPCMPSEQLRITVDAQRGMLLASLPSIGRCCTYIWLYYSFSDEYDIWVHIFHNSSVNILCLFHQVFLAFENSTISDWLSLIV